MRDITGSVGNRSLEKATPPACRAAFCDTMKEHYRFKRCIGGVVYEKMRGNYLLAFGALLYVCVVREKKI